MGGLMMTDNTKKKMLLAVDGSENSLEIVRYAAKIPAFREMATVYTMSAVRSLKGIGIWKRTVRPPGGSVKPGFGKKNMTKLFRDACEKRKTFFSAPVFPRNPWK
jgi:hypothetical protein